MRLAGVCKFLNRDIIRGIQDSRPDGSSNVALRNIRFAIKSIVLHFIDNHEYDLIAFLSLSIVLPVVSREGLILSPTLVCM